MTLGVRCVRLFLACLYTLRVSAYRLRAVVIAVPLYLRTERIKATSR